MADSGACNDEDPERWIHTIRNKIKILGDKELSRLSSAVGANWELAMPELGLTAAEIDRCVQGRPNYVQMQIYDCLALWKRKIPSDAHLEKFVTTLKNCPSITVDWKEVKRIAEDFDLECDRESDMAFLR